MYEKKPVMYIKTRWRSQRIVLAKLSDADAEKRFRATCNRHGIPARKGKFGVSGKGKTIYLVKE